MRAALLSDAADDAGCHAEEEGSARILCGQLINILASTDYDIANVVIYVLYNTVLQPSQMLCNTHRNIIASCVILSIV